MALPARNCTSCGVRSPNCFCGLQDETLRALQSIGRPLRFAAGVRVVREGFAANRVYVICEGVLKLTVSSPDGKLLILRIAGPGDVLGLASMLKGTAHDTTAETLEQCELKVIERDEFFAFMQNFNEVGRNSAIAVAVEYESAIFSAKRLALSGSAAAKLAVTLLEWGRMHKPKEGAPMHFQMPLTHEELGNMAGISRETVTRLLSKFRREGLLEQTAGRMVLCQPEKMEQMYC
jgi:CRP/FNR family transcriptional regulator, cyclic AMP receptor protein